LRRKKKEKKNSKSLVPTEADDRDSRLCIREVRPEAERAGADAGFHSKPSRSTPPITSLQSRGEGTGGVWNANPQLHQP